MTNPLHFVKGLLYALFTDPIVMSLALGTVALGVWSGYVLVGVAAFFLMYSVQRTVLQVANAAGIGLREVAAALRALLRAPS